jgi:nucleotide-binding universal stress UspA family protein
LKTIAFIDGSNYSASVCDHASWLAEQLEIPIEVFHILGRRNRDSQPADLSGSLKLGARTELLEKLSKADEEWSKLAQERGRMILDDACERIKQKTSQDVIPRLRHDDFVETVVSFEDDARLVIIGKRGEASGFAREHLGSNLERALRSTKKPVLVVNREFKPIKSCVLAYDGSGSTDRAVEFIVNNPILRDTSIHLVTVGQDGNPNFRQKLDQAAQKLSHVGINTTSEVRSGNAELMILDTAKQKDADMLIMGAYGHSRVRNFIIGSTTTALVRACLLPCLMFR